MASRSTTTTSGVDYGLYTFILATYLSGGMLLCWYAGHLDAFFDLSAQIPVYGFLKFRKDYLILIFGMIILFAFLNTRKAFKAGIAKNFEEFKRTIAQWLATSSLLSFVLFFVFVGVVPTSFQVFTACCVILWGINDLFVAGTYKVHVDVSSQGGEIVAEMGGFWGVLRTLVTIVIAALLAVTIWAMCFSGPDGTLSLKAFEEFGERFSLHGQYIMIIILLIAAIIVNILVFSVSKRIDVILPHLPNTILSSSLLRLVILYVLVYYLDMPLNTTSMCVVFVFGIMMGCVNIPSILEFLITTAKEGKG